MSTTEGVTSLADLVSHIFKECLLDEAGHKEDAVIVTGVMHTITMSRTKLEQYRSDIKSILDQMDPTFHKSGGGGWSFLNLCVAKNGKQWTGMHRTMDELVVLAIATEMGDFLMPRDMWNVLPGGMPYIVFDTEE